MVIKTCEMCGVEFEAPNKMYKYCNDCNVDCFKSLRSDEKPKKKNPNQRLIDDVKAATKAGLSYGNFKGRTNYEICTYI